MQALTSEQSFRSRFASQLAGRHSLGLSVGLHLLPGLLTGAIYYLLAQPVAQLLLGMGCPNILFGQPIFEILQSITGAVEQGSPVCRYRLTGDRRCRKPKYRLVGVR